MTTLKPCPFCGATAQAALRPDARITIACTDDCNCAVAVKVEHSKSDFFETGSCFSAMLLEDILAAYEEAAKKWNTRVGGG